MKIATFLASATEIVCALGLRERLVGVSHECDWPPDVSALPRLTRARIEHQRPSQAIHDDVEALVRAALSLYDVDLDALVRAAPDVLVTQDLCAVCAVAADDVRRAAARVLAKEVAIVSLAPTRLADVWGDVVRVGHALGMGMTAEAVANGLRSRVAKVAARTAALAERPRVLALEWLAPLMVGGLWMPDIIAAAGGLALVGEAGARGVVLGDDVVVEPDVIVVKPCGFDLARSLHELAADGGALQRALRERWPAARVVVADGNALFNRSGPRLVESVEVMAAILHPVALADLAARHAASFSPLA